MPIPRLFQAGSFMWVWLTYDIETIVNWKINRGIDAKMLMANLSSCDIAYNFVQDSYSL